MSRAAPICGIALTATAVMVLVFNLLVDTQHTHAQTREPTPSPTPSVSLLLPRDVVVLLPGSVRWRDESTGEDGYRVVATLGAETRTFDLPADATALTLPEDFRPTCVPPGWPLITLRVFAFKGEQEGEAATGGNNILCPPATATPPPASVTLPGTGSGNDGGRSRTYDAMALSAIALAALALAVLRLTSALRRRR